MTDEKIETVAVGNVASQYTLLSYVINDLCAIVVTAREGRDHTWNFAGAIDNEIVITGTVHGGRARTARYIKFIRNGILSCRLKGKVNPNPQKKENDNE